MFHEAAPSVWQCWPAPIFRRLLADTAGINLRLSRAIQARARCEPSARSSNGDAWQSEADFFEDLDADKIALAEHISAATSHMNHLVGIAVDGIDSVLEAWCLINRSGQHHNRHIHHSSVWSGVYYVQVPDQFDAARERHGAIEFLDPRHGAPVNSRSILTIRPVAGLLLLFPSWLEHWVHPHYAMGDRISVPFNIYMRPKGAA